MWQRFSSFFRAILRRRDFETGMTEEMRFHIEQYTDDLVRSGVPRNEAVRRARMEFGTVDGIKDDCREVSGFSVLDSISRNLRFTLRSLRKTPGFAAAAVLPLALCLGANLAIFAVVDAVLLRPLPFPEADRLVTMYNSYPKAGVDRDGSSIPNYFERRGNIAAFEQLSLYRYRTAVVGETGSTERLEILQVTPEFFTTLGRGPVVGRAFTGQDENVAILTDLYKRQHFRGGASAIGRQIRMDGEAKIVVGVLPPDFRFLSSEAAVYVPLTTRPEQRAAIERHSNSSTDLIARLRPGASLEEAQAQVTAHDASIAGTYPQAKMMADAGFHTKLVSLHADHVASIRPTLILLQAGVLFLLLIGAVNLINLLLVRASGRTKELAVRLALGASKKHVIGEVIVESTVLTLFGGLLGLGVGAAGVRILALFGAERLPLGSQIAVDGRVALAALIGSTMLGVVVGLPIAWFNIRRHLGNALQAEVRGATSNAASQRLRHGFAMAQIALAFVLLSGAGMLSVSLQQVMSVTPGFRPDHIATAQILMPWNRYPGPEAESDFAGRLIEEIRKRPGVLAAGAVSNIPLSKNDIKSAVTIVGQRLPPGASPRAHYAYSVTGDYFAAMGVPLRNGRFLDTDDSRRRERYCVVDEDFVRRYWPQGDTIGRRLFLGSEEGKAEEAFTVVGVVGAVKQTALTESDGLGAVYFPFRYRADSHLYIVARTGLPPETIGASLRSVVQSLDSELPVYDVRSMEVRVADSLSTRRAPALMAGIFAGMALLLAAIGTYGVLSYAVSQRRREIGVRMALGARPSQIRGQFVAVALRMLAGGAVLGVMGAWATGQAMQAVLYRVPALHWATLIGAGVVMGVVCLLACLIPSQRAAGVSPREALTES